ncbi:hypothetical protein GCM10010221_16220 [Streptomyces parvus]|nr:hypothetical protein GCM10010221_16220 [Streptomyces parvus]
MRGQGDEPRGLDGCSERAEDPLGDEQGVQVGPAQGAFGQALEAFGDEFGEQAHPAALDAHPLHGGPLPPQFRLSLGEGILHARQHGLDAVSVLRVGGVLGEGVAHVLQRDPGIGHPADPQQADHVLVAVAAAVIATPLRLGEQTDPVVVADRPWCAAGEGRSVADLDLTGWHERRGHGRGPSLKGSGRTSTGPHDATEGATLSLAGIAVNSERTVQ